MIAAICLLATLAGCAVPVAVVVAPAPIIRPAAPPPPPRPSVASEAARIHYARVQASLLAQGLMRTDGGGPDTPFNDRVLAENFLRIALFDEYTAADGQLVAAETESRLRRWEQPIRMRAEFGATVPPDQRVRDRANVASYAARLGRVTGAAISQGASGANFHVLFLNEDDRIAAGPRLRALVPGISEAAVRAVTGMPRSTFCVVFAFSGPGGGAYTKAVAVIRGEHPDLLRLSCIHEELAQGLGLANDSPAARPSVFNDDEEFALLTRQDELMLRMLYDPRLKPGMSGESVSILAQKIATELLAAAS